MKWLPLSIAVVVLVATSQLHAQTPYTTAASGTTDATLLVQPTGRVAGYNFSIFDGYAGFPLNCHCSNCFHVWDGFCQEKVEYCQRKGSGHCGRPGGCGRRLGCYKPLAHCRTTLHGCKTKFQCGCKQACGCGHDLLGGLLHKCGCRNSCGASACGCGDMVEGEMIMPDSQAPDSPDAQPVPPAPMPDASAGSSPPDPNDLLNSLRG